METENVRYNIMLLHSTHRRSRFNYWSPYFEAVYLWLIASGLRGNDGNEKWNRNKDSTAKIQRSYAYLISFNNELQ